MFSLKFQLLLLLLLLSFGSLAQTLERRVSLKLEEQTLQAALQQIQQQYKVEFSYLNNDLPAAKSISLQVKQMPLRQVLDKLLQNTGLGYTEYKGRVIISKNLSKIRPAPVNLPKARAREKALSVAASDTVPQETGKNEAVEMLPLLASVKVAAVAPASASSVPHIEPPSGLDVRLNQAVFSKIETQAAPEEKVIHVGLIYPLSNQGLKAGRYVNNFSFHGLIAYSAGLQGIEVSGIGNIENDFAEGFQLAGLFNIVKNRVHGQQIGGMLNIVGDSLQGIQLGGFGNYTRTYHRGLQAAGFANVAGQFRGMQLSGFGNFAAHVRGVQYSGFINMANDARGAQFSGWGNFAKTMHGLQGAGIGNIAGTVNGMQLSGFGNLAQRVRGMQLAPFFNLADHVKGVQLAVFNVADSVEGVSIGLLSFVKKGHQSLEVWTAEDFGTNLAFKTGVARFYNIFAAGLPTKGAVQWGVGYGVGSQWRLNRRLFLNTDLLAYSVYERKLSEGWFENKDLNMLNKFRLLFGWKPLKVLTLFAGPTFNAMLSRHQQADGSVGSGIVDHGFYNKTSDKGTNLRMWLGFNAGLRF